MDSDSSAETILSCAKPNTKVILCETIANPGMNILNFEKFFSMLFPSEVSFLNRCIIITSFQSAPLRESFELNDEDFIICADGGFLHAKAEGIVPDVLIGDFDSMDFEYEAVLSRPENSGYEIIRLATEKDDTDTMVCLKYGIDRGFENFFILGGLGGRLDHTIANLQTISYAIDRGKNVWILDGKNRATLRNPGSLIIEKRSEYKLSLFSYGECCAGVCIKGVKYPLQDCLLTHSFPLGVSNEFKESKAEISHSSGKLCIVLSKD